jgi:hypothetical protein
MTDRIKICGITFSHDKKIAHKVNVLDKIDKMESNIVAWLHRGLSIPGKIVVINTFGISQLIYTMQICPYDSEDLKRIERIIFKFLWNKKWLGINVTAYADTWLKPEEQVGGSSKIVNTIVEAIKIAKNKIDDDFSPILFCTHPMDRTTCQELADKISAPVVDNSTYLSHDIQALMRKCDLFMGMRFHSVVLASAVESPIIGLIYAPKVRGFMRLLDCEEYGLELASLAPEILAEKICSAWNIRKEIQAKQKSVIDKLKVGARNAATTLKNKIFPNYSHIADISENRKLTAY